jgi:hypothetical protein
MNRRQFLKNALKTGGAVVLASVKPDVLAGSLNPYIAGSSGPVTNDIGTPGAQGFGIGVCPLSPAGFTGVTGYTSKANDAYGNYQYSDGSIMCWIPKFYYRIGHADNPTYGVHGVNSVDIKGVLDFASTSAANDAGYALHRAFVDGDNEQPGFFFDKYMCSKNAKGAGYVASSIQNGLPLSTNSAHNQLTDLTACAGNYYYETINAAHARDGVNGAVNASSIFHVPSRMQYAALALLALAHGQAAASTTNCAWYHATYNYPKGCNNDELKDVNDTAVIWESDGYSNCGKTGSAGYGGGAGNVFAKSTHNGQNCGVADLNGLMWEVSLGVTCIAASKSITGATKANPCQLTITGHGYTTGDIIQIASVGGMTQLNSKLFTITNTGTDTITLDAIDSSAYTDYTLGGTATKGAFYTAKQATRMRDFTSGAASATDHWGAAGVAAMMDAFSPAFVLPAGGTFSQRFGSGSNQVLGDALSGAEWLLAGLGFPQAAAGMDTTGTELFGKDYYYQSIVNQLCLLSCGGWSSSSNAGVWYVYWYNARPYSHYYVGFRAACYLV